MSYKIVADSSANVFKLENTCFECVPLKIITDKEYVDNAELDVRVMVDEVKKYKGRSGTSCPNVNDWIEAFDNHDVVFGVSITSKLSGSYNAGRLAMEQYMDENPGKNVYIVDSLSAGGQLKLIIDKLKVLLDSGLSFEEVKAGIEDYNSHLHTVFSLESLANLARNGRVNPAVAAAVNALGIRVIAEACEGEIKQINKCRGEKKAIKMIYEEMKKKGYKGGKVAVSHTFNENACLKLKELILNDYPNCDMQILDNGALCSFYAEEGGFIVGFEDY